MKQHRHYEACLVCLATLKATTPAIIESALSGDDETAIDTRHELETLVRFAEVMRAEGRAEK